MEYVLKKGEMPEPRYAEKPVAHEQKVEESKIEQKLIELEKRLEAVE